MDTSIGVTVEELRKIVLALPGVEEGPCYGTPGFRVRKKLLARLWEDGETLVLKVDPYARESLLRLQPETFFLTDHYSGYPYVLVRLKQIEPSQLGELLEAAWRAAAPKKLLEQPQDRA